MANVKTAATPASAGDPKANKKMAKAMKKEQKKASGKKSKVWLVILLVFVVLVGGFTALVVFDVFGLRTNVVNPLLSNVPIIGGLFEQEIDPETGLPVQAYDPSATLEALEARILELEGDLEQALANNLSIAEERDVLYITVNEHELENERLRELEEYHLEFLASRAQFEREVAEGNEDAFVEFFATMHPELAEEIYNEIMAGRALDEQWQNYLSSWGSTAPVNVARVVELMATTDMPMIARVMTYLPVNQRTAIFNNLSPDTLAALYRQMYPN
ncbi:MAG: hypothetical protein FWB98_07620 [Defluviitaleaceae bacterium]|nr:hypothetical protein [Defluviitaleaceae bacterium]